VINLIDKLLGAQCGDELIVVWGRPIVVVNDGELWVVLGEL